MAKRSYTSKASTSGGRVNIEPFELDGVDFAPSGDIGLLDLAELARYSALDADDPAGLAAMADFFRLIFGSEYDRFRKHCRTHHTEPEMQLKIITDIVEELSAGFPTTPSRPSPGGSTNTGPGPKGSRSSTAPSARAVRRAAGTTVQRAATAAGQKAKQERVDQLQKMVDDLQRQLREVTDSEVS